jgi:GNAT superfamily N-acetyltransferase
VRLNELSHRPGSADDALSLAEVAVAGWETYRTFAPPGWTPAPLDEEHRRVLATLRKPSAWCEIADDGSTVAGHAIVLAASEARIVDATPGLAHLFQLMIRPRYWGSGLAARLHDGALAAASERGFGTMRLFTPAAHARARRFYEREGWAPHGEPTLDEGFGMEIVEYRRDL